MYEYMKALQIRFVGALKQSNTSEALRKELSDSLELENRKKLLRLIDEALQLAGDYSLHNFVCGFLLAPRIEDELKTHHYSFEEEFEESAHPKCFRVEGC